MQQCKEMDSSLQSRALCWSARNWGTQNKWKEMWALQPTSFQMETTTMKGGAGELMRKGSSGKAWEAVEFGSVRWEWQQRK